MNKKQATKKAPKKAKPLTPVFDKNRNSWRLSVPATVAPDGRRQRLFFETKTAAEIEVQRLKGMTEKWGSEGRKVSAALAQDAAKAAELLEGHDISLTALAASYIKAQEARTKSVSFSQAWRQFRDSREEKSTEHLRALDRIGGKLVDEIGKVNLRDLSADRLEKAVSKHFKSAHSFNLALRSISPLFNMALRKSPAWIDANPCKAIDKRDTGRAGPISIVSVAEARSLLKSCKDWSDDKKIHDNYKVDATDALPAIAIMLFAGVRPAEIKRLVWGDVDLDEGTIFISNRKAKTDRSREIEMPETLIDWLKATALKAPERNGSVVPTNWKRKIQIVRTKAGIATTGRDQLRKSFASYHLRAFDDVNKTRSIMGHETDDVLFTNYRNAVRKKDALQFWQILPTGKGAKLRSA